MWKATLLVMFVIVLAYVIYKMVTYDERTKND